MPEASLRVLIAGGGTGGHVIPALAIAKELRDRHGAEVRFVGTSRGFETRLVPEAGFALDLIQVGQLKGVSLQTRLKTMLDLPLGVRRCLQILRTFRPHVVVGVGGYASGPGMVAALLKRTPTLAFEPNAVPGLANRLVGKWVSAAAVSFPPGVKYFRNAEVTGIPVRPEFFGLKPRPEGSPPNLLVFGGSQGARVLNQTLAADRGQTAGVGSRSHDSAPGRRAHGRGDPGRLCCQRRGPERAGRFMRFSTTCRAASKPPTWCWRAAEPAPLRNSARPANPLCWCPFRKPPMIINASMPK